MGNIGMNKYIYVLLVAVIVSAGIYAVKHAQNTVGDSKVTNTHKINRIVSLAPSVTETIFALGGDDKLVGVTRYCDYPPAAKGKSSIGGYIDPDFEAIFRLRPDLVIVTIENRDTIAKLKSFGLKTLVVDQNNIAGILSSITLIGDAISKQQRASEIVSGINSRIVTIKLKVKGLARPSVLLSMGRAMGGDITEVYAAGKGNLYDEIIGIAGGINAFDSKVAMTPALSGEGITRLNPDIIIDLAPDKQPSDAAKIASDWNRLTHASAVANKRVHALTGDYTVVPGPRFINTLEDVAKIIHPEVN